LQTKHTHHYYDNGCWPPHHPAQQYLADPTHLDLEEPYCSQQQDQDECNCNDEKHEDPAQALEQRADA
jgi:hypothetical protein